MILDRLSAEKLTKYATQAAVALSSTLFLLKLFAWLSTGSDTLKMSCFDSGFDIVISASNLLIITLIIRKQNPNFIFGYDKVAAIAALSQVLLIMGIISYTLLGTLSFEIPQSNQYSIVVLVISLLLSFILIQFQRYVTKRTNSIIVKADMLHYQTDLFINSVSIIVLVITQFYQIWWLDTVLAIIIGLYLMKTIGKLGIESLSILLDRKIPSHELTHLKALLKKYNTKNLNVTFSGMREFINFKLIFDGTVTMGEIDKEISKLKTVIKEHKANRIVTITPVLDKTM